MVQSKTETQRRHTIHKINRTLHDKNISKSIKKCTYSTLPKSDVTMQAGWTKLRTEKLLNMAVTDFWYQDARDKKLIQYKT